MNAFDFGEFRKPRNSKNGSGFSAGDRRLDVNQAVLESMMADKTISYWEISKLSSFEGMSTNYLGRTCKCFDSGSVKVDGLKSQTTVIAVSAENAARAFDFLNKNASERLEHIAEQLGKTVQELFDDISTWRSEERSELVNASVSDSSESQN